MRIAHISDIHCNYGSDFNEKMFDKAIPILNKFEADFVFISGDLTTEGLLSEYELAKEKLKQINGKLLIVPGNHDERNLGYKLFPEFFGEPSFFHEYDELNFIGLASSEPDKDNGRLGRRRHKLIEEGINKNNKMSIIGFHHHVVPVPNSGRETNIIDDAGETLDIIIRNEVPLVLMGHRHVPWGVKIHKTLLVNAGTFSCTRTRAHFGNTFNLIDVNNNIIEVTVVNVGEEKEKKMMEFDLLDGSYTNRYYG
ncbi:MAG: metallophosphoesterase [Candidatus Thermoplasmatota archaeon]|nr:metallophosphoesterase [Candidatus Thermoplasmatota archaeon]